MISKIKKLFRGRGSQEELHASVAVTVRKSSYLPHLFYVEMRVPVDADPITVLNVHHVPHIVSRSTTVPPDVVYRVAYSMLESLITDTTFIVRRSSDRVLLVRQS
jgi:hypothetical protein